MRPQPRVMRKRTEHCMLRSGTYRSYSLAQAHSRVSKFLIGGASIALVLSIIYKSKISFTFRVPAMWIFSQRSYRVNLDLLEPSVSQSRNYPAERRVHPNPLEPLGRYVLSDTFFALIDRLGGYFAPKMIVYQISIS